MPTNHTENYGLSQWEKTDKVLMEDFNADNAKIDGALAELSGKADSVLGTLSDKPWKSVIYEKSGASTHMSSDQFTSLFGVDWAANEIVCLHVFYKEAEKYASHVLSITLGTEKVADITVQDFMIVLFPLRDPARKAHGVLLCSTPKLFYLEQTFGDLYGIILKVPEQASRPGKCFFGLN